MLQSTIRQLNTLLCDGYEESGTSHLWLADSHDTRVSIGESHNNRGELPQVDEHWESPFLGQTMQEAAELVTHAPKSPKGPSQYSK